MLLRVGFTVAPILFGLDKFLDWLVDWRIYLAPQINDLDPWQRPPGDAGRRGDRDHRRHRRRRAPEVRRLPRRRWLAGIIVNLLIAADFYDIALRDFGLLLGALALARLATAFERPRHTSPR